MSTRKNRTLADLASALALNIAETAAVTGIGANTITAEINARRLKSRVVARRRIVLVSDLRCWLDSLPEAPSKAPANATSTETKSEDANVKKWWR